MNHCKQKEDIDKRAIRYIFILLIQRIIGIGLFFVAAGTFNDIRGNINIILYCLYYCHCNAFGSSRNIK
jgi:hypothetical protein